MVTDLIDLLKNKVDQSVLFVKLTGVLDSCIFNFSLQLLRRVLKIQFVMFNTFFPLIHRDLL